MSTSSPKLLTANAALLIDAAGCFAGAAVLLLAPAVWDLTDLPTGWRMPVIVALFLFSVLLVATARYPGRLTIALAVLGNLAWIVAGSAALFVTESFLGGLIIGLVMVADAVMAWYQAAGLKVAHVAAGDNT